MRTSYIVTLRPEREIDQGAEARALRAMLKALLRTYGMVCVDIREAKAKPLAEHGQIGNGRNVESLKLHYNWLQRLNNTMIAEKAVPLWLR